MRQNANQTRLPVHGKGPSNLDLNWLLATPKLKRLKNSMWKSIVGAWLNVRPGLIKSDPTNSDEVLRQPLFGNPSILNLKGILLGVGARAKATPLRTPDAPESKTSGMMLPKNGRGSQT